MRSKGDPTTPNEDALFAVESADRVLVAVADAHFGAEASHEWIRAVAELPRIPSDLDELEHCIRPKGGVDDRTRSATTLLVAVLDRSRGRGFGVSIGDSSAVVVGPSGARRVNMRDKRYLPTGSSQSLGAFAPHPFGFRATADQLFLVFTDGVDECCYRSPNESVTLRHLGELYTVTGADCPSYCDRLSAMALEGVNGHPGGQDNVALVVTRVSSS